MVEISFNKALFVPLNYSTFNESVLDIVLVPGQGQDPLKTKFTWKITDFTENGMNIQLTFESPLYISSSNVILLTIIFRL